MIPKAEFYRLGFISDALQCVSSIRHYFRECVAAARDAIYKDGSPIKGTFPEMRLKAFSLVPTFVCCSLLISTIINHTFPTRTHLLRHLDPWVSTSIVRSQWIYYMSLS